MYQINFNFKFMYHKINRVIAMGGLGDMLLSTPAIKALKLMNEKAKVIVYCASEEGRSIFRNNPYVDGVKDTSFFSDPVLYSLYTFKLKRRHHYSIMYGRYSPTPSYDKSATEMIAEMLGVELQDKRIQIFLTREEEDKAAVVMARYHNPIELHVRSLTSKNQEWAPENWNELVRQMPEYTFVQVGVNADEKVEGAVDCRGKTTFREAMALVSQARAFAGVNSSFSHSTNAFGVPGVVLFGPSGPTIWGHSNNINIYKPLPCSPCIDLILDRKCPYGKPCMHSITVEEVKQALLRQLQPAGKEKRVANLDKYK